ncbi:FtsX-like permease family protein [Lysinibacillus sp. NPDC097231]|uniref:FtsX-like permease family protein n=1 Tax=Lysinibacillus sp. NPDC097231 TaxID=3364142 RepID=UPI00380937D1
MMNFKLIYKNVRRSIKDYVIYFLTLALGVSLFYAFNSVSSQPALNDLNYSMEVFGDALVLYIGLLTKFIAIIFAFLIIYANQFIMKRRKKEMGVYMTLGMSKWRISSIFVGETFLVGLFALIIGLWLGFLMSQVISILALKMFVGNAVGYKLLLSIEAIKETILSFSIIFIIVALFNTRNIMNIKLIDLLIANRKNQELKVHNKWVTGILFLLAIISIFFGVLLLFKYGLDKDCLTGIVSLLGVGIVLFYYTISGVMILLVKKNKKLYFRELNSFLFRQFGSKMQINFLVMSILCALLTASLVVLGTGFSVTSSMNKQVTSATPFDLTIAQPYDDNIGILERAEQDGIPLKENLNDYAEIMLYNTGLTYGDLFKGQQIELSDLEQEILMSQVTFITETDYNQQLELLGERQIQLEENNYIINASYERFIKYIQYFLNNVGKVSIGDNELIPADKNVFDNIIYLTNSTMANDVGTIVVPDEMGSLMNSDSFLLNGIFSSQEIEGKVYKVMNNKWIEKSLDGSIYYVTKSVIQDTYFGVFGVVAFICSYLGIILMIVTLSILALQQLTETQDNKERYMTLSKIGADKKMINRLLYRQIGFYFISPLILASILSIFTTKVVLEKLEPFFEISIKQNMFVSFGIILLLYAIYFIATYQSAKQVIVDGRLK